MDTRILEQSLQLNHALLKNVLLISNIEQVIKLITRAFSNGHGVFICGTGSTHAIASYLTTCLSDKLYMDRPALPVSLFPPASYSITYADSDEISNKYSRYIQSQAQNGDILIVLAGEGNSRNIINAMKTANEMGMITTALTDQDGGKIGSIAQYLITIPSIDKADVNQAYLLIGHLICSEVERQLFDFNIS